MMVGFVVIAVLRAAPVASPAVPVQRGGPHVISANTSGSVDLGKVGSYRIAVTVPTDRVAIFYLYKYEVKGPRNLTVFATAYAVHSRSSLKQGLIRARFGSLGAFSFRFRPDGRVRKRGVPRGCEGQPPVTEYGRFVGHSSFQGENGFLDFTRASGAGWISRSSRLLCKGAAAAESPRKSLRAHVAPGSFFVTQGDIALLYATTHRHGRYVGVTAGHEEGSPPGAEVRIGVLESRKRMAIGRYGLILGPPGTLLTSLPGVHPATATLDPPAPFYGSGSYLESSTPTRKWSGSLGVNLPGLKLPLTGPEFHARLCVLNPLRTRRGCDFFKAEPPPPDERPALQRLALG
jgi:hypothetical protein